MYHIGGNILQILYGMCQGNVMAPMVWLLLKSIVVAAFQTFGFSRKTRDPNTLIVFTVSGVLYMDDTDLFILDEGIRCIQQIKESHKAP